MSVPINESVIILENIRLSYGDRLIFHDLNWSLASQRWTCLLGQSGVGKSSFLRLIAGLLPEEARVDGKCLLQKEIAYLGQNDALLPWLTVFENASLCSRLRSHSKAAKMKIWDQTRHLLERVGLSEAADLYPNQLSGGMRQRTALVRALVEDKPIVLMDEPFSRLDAITRHQLQDLAAELLQNKTVLLVTHDPAEALRIGNQIELLSGSPAVIQRVVTFASSGPRDLSHPELLSLQKNLYQMAA